MAQSLLAHMYSHIRGSQEDIATYSLQYIISQSEILNKAFTHFLESSLHAKLDDGIHYSCQSVGKKKERPDISGFTFEGKEIVLCEAKFYAGLTSNQPEGYLDRLKEEDGTGLVFICPEPRRRVLWNNLLELCESRALELIDDYCAIIDGIHMSIVTWSEVIEMLQRTAASSAVSSLSDIYQLDGFCKLIDDNAFIPFSKEDLWPENARREERLYQVIDAVMEQLVSDKSVANKGKLKAASNRNGYVRYVFCLGYGLSIMYDRAIWKNPNTEDTPFWVSVRNMDFNQTQAFLTVLKSYPESWKANTANGLALPLFAPTDASLDEVAKDMAEQIMQYVQEVK